MNVLLPLLFMTCICPADVELTVPFPEVYQVEPYRPTFTGCDDWAEINRIENWHKTSECCRRKPAVPEPATVLLLSCGLLLWRVK